MTDYTLKIWKHPATGETRIYVNGGDITRGDKLFICAAKADCIGPKWDAKLWTENAAAYHRNGYGSNTYDMGLAIAEKALAERGLDRVDFDKIVEALNG